MVIKLKYFNLKYGIISYGPSPNNNHEKIVMFKIKDYSWHRNQCGCRISGVGDYSVKPHVAGDGQ